MEELKKLYIVGAGGFGREVAWLVERINAVNPTWNLVGFLDDNETIHGKLEDEYPVLGGCSYLAGTNEECWVVCAVGSSKVRKKIIEKLHGYANVKFATLIDPSVIISKRVSIGEGTIICAGTIVTVDITIGSHVIINLDCTIGHDAVLQDCVTLYPSVNVSGNCTIGECVELGTGMQIIQGRSVVKDTIVGAGAVVVKDLEEKGTYVGVPAGKISYSMEMSEIEEDIQNWEKLKKEHNVK